MLVAECADDIISVDPVVTVPTFEAVADDEDVTVGSVSWLVEAVAVPDAVSAEVEWLLLEDSEYECEPADAGVLTV